MTVDESIEILDNILFDKYVEEQRKEAIEEFKQSDEYSSGRIW